MQGAAFRALTSQTGPALAREREGSFRLRSCTCFPRWAAGASPAHPGRKPARGEGTRFAMFILKTAMRPLGRALRPAGTTRPAARSCSVSRLLRSRCFAPRLLLRTFKERVQLPLRAGIQRRGDLLAEPLPGPVQLEAAGSRCVPSLCPARGSWLAIRLPSYPTAAPTPSPVGTSALQGPCQHRWSGGAVPAGALWTPG